MALELDAETRLALVEEIKRRIPSGERKRIAYAIAAALGTGRSTEEPRLSRLLKQDADTVEQMLGPERAEKVLDAVCSELKVEVAELVRVARRAARPRPRPAPDRHPAWQELGDAAPWVECVPGLPDGTEALRRAIESGSARQVIWLVGPAGSGKTARLWRAQQQNFGQILTGRVPDKAEPGAVWLVDEPDDPEAWIAGAARCQARLVIATGTARRTGDVQAQLELGPWTRPEVESFLNQLGDLRPGHEALDAVDLELIADKLAALASAWTPLDLGNVIRLFVDEPALLDRDANDRELRIRSALHQLLSRAELSPDLEKLWHTHGRSALALAAATAVRGAERGRLVAPVGEPVLREALAVLAGVTVGGLDGEPLRAIVERIRKESGKDDKKAFQMIEALAQAPSSDALIELLVGIGVWRRTDDAMLVPVEEALVLTLAAEHLDDDWMWNRLRDTLADFGWSNARIEWAARLGRVQERLDELLATGAAVHVGAIELAVALVAFAPESPRPDQVERAVFSAVQLLSSPPLNRLGLGPQLGPLREAVRSASRRYRRILPPVIAALTSDDLVQRCTESTRRIIGAAESLTEKWPKWVRDLTASSVPAWVVCAKLLPWQALSALQDPAGRATLRSMSSDWEAVIMDYAADGHAWARAVATGDVEGLAETLELVSSRGLLRALGRWPGSPDSQRHEQALVMVLRGLPSRHDGSRSRLYSKLVRATADLVRRHPEHPLPPLVWLRAHEELWREALDQAPAIDLLQTWFDGELRELSRSMDPSDPWVQRYLEATPSRLPPAAAASVASLLRLGELLHRHGNRAPLLELLEQTEPRPSLERTSAAWELGVGAAAALLQRQDAESLHAMQARHGSAQEHAVAEVLSRNHDEKTVLWIANNLGERYEVVLASIAGRPERREAAKRWALDPSDSRRRHAAAGWLLEHPAAGEREHVRWLLTNLPVAHSRFYARAGLTHPDEAVRRAAAALLQRALDELGAAPDLASVARCFYAPLRSGDAMAAMWDLGSYLGHVNASRHDCSAGSIRALIDAMQRHLATASDQEAWYVHGLCSLLATAARRVQIDYLASWVREPLGEHATALVTPSRIAEVREAIANGILSGSDGADLDREVLQALADTASTEFASQAWSLLLERDPPTDEQLMSEWASASDAVIAEEVSGTARWYAIRDLLQWRDPHGYARALADRLLALPPHLRRSGILQISKVAQLDARQAERLSPLFD